MRVRFLKPIVSIFGTFEPGMETDVSNPKITDSWLRNGIAKEVKKRAAPAHRHYYPKDSDVCRCGYVRQKAE